MSSFLLSSSGNSPSRASPGPYACATVSRSLHKVYTADFSYMEINDVANIQAMVPRPLAVVYEHRKQPQGEHSQALSPSPATLGDALAPATGADGSLGSASQQVAKKNPALFYFGSQSNSGKTDVSPDGVAVIKAKDEKYAFKDTTDENMMKDKDVLEFTLVNGELVRRELSPAEKLDRILRGRRLYRCTLLRLNNNIMSNLHELEKILPLLIYKPFATISVIDLSFNHLAQVPEEVTYLPLHTLLLHSNRITSLNELAKLRPLAKSLRTLTLNDNPLQNVPVFKTDGRQSYRLSALTQLPFLTSLDSIHVTRLEQERLSTFVQVFLPPKARKLLPPLSRVK